MGGGPGSRATTEERRRARAAYKQVGGRGVGARSIAGEAPRTYYTSTPQTPQTRASRKQTGGAGAPLVQAPPFSPLKIAKNLRFWAVFLLIFCNFLQTIYQNFTFLVSRFSFPEPSLGAGAQVEKGAKKGRGQSINRSAACSICYFVGLQGYADKPLTRALRPVTPC